MSCSPLDQLNTSSQRQILAQDGRFKLTCFRIQYNFTNIWNGVIGHSMENVIIPQNLLALICVWCGVRTCTVAVRCVYATVPISDPISFNRNFVILEEVHDVNYLDRRLPYELCTMNT